jgi:hypothetical protein
MPKKTNKKKNRRIKRKEIMAKILLKISEALKEYATPVSERKITSKIRKASKKSAAVLQKTENS